MLQTKKKKKLATGCDLVLFLFQLCQLHFITILQFCVHSDKHKLMQSLTEDILQGANFETILNQLCEAIGQGNNSCSRGNCLIDAIHTFSLSSPFLLQSSIHKNNFRVYLDNL